MTGVARGSYRAPPPAYPGPQPHTRPPGPSSQSTVRAPSPSSVRPPMLSTIRPPISSIVRPPIIPLAVRPPMSLTIRSPISPGLNNVQRTNPEPIQQPTTPSITLTAVEQQLFDDLMSAAKFRTDPKRFELIRMLQAFRDNNPNINQYNTMLAVVTIAALTLY